jgi:hypothetical protein
VTQQVEDVIVYEGNEHHFTLVVGGPLVDAGWFGFRPQAYSTGCKRGYWCRYAVRDRSLRLADLEVYLPDELTERLKAGRDLPTVFGLVPRLIGDNTFGLCGNARLQDAFVPIAFTGAMVIGRGFLDPFPFGGLWGFETVLELRFTDGRLDAAFDRSADGAFCRDVSGPYWDAYWSRREGEVRGRADETPPACPSTDPMLPAKPDPSSPTPGLDPAFRRNFRPSDLREERARRLLTWPLGEAVHSLPRDTPLRALVPGELERKVLDAKLGYLLPSGEHEDVRTVMDRSLGDALDILMRRMDANGE